MNQNEKSSIILNTFRDLCIQVGLDQFSMKKLSQSCGIPMGSIYNIFNSRTEIFNETYKMCFITIYAGLMTNNHFTVDELRIRIKLFIDNCINNKNDFTFFDTYAFHPLNNLKIVYDENHKLGDTSIGALMKDQIIYDMKPHLMMNIILGIVSKSLKYLFHFGLSMTEGDKDNLVEATIRAIVLSKKD